MRPRSRDLQGVRRSPRRGAGWPGGTENVGGIAVEVMPVAVVAAGRARVCVPHGVLHILQGYAALPGTGGERVAQRVRATANWRRAGRRPWPGGAG